MAKIDFKENGSKGVESSKNGAHEAKEREREDVNQFEHVSIRPLDRLAHLVHKHGESFSDYDLGGFNTALECEAHQVRELVSMLGGVCEIAPCLDYGQEIDIHDLRQHYREIFEALAVAIDELSKFSDLGLACAYAGKKLASRLSTLKGGKHEIRLLT